MPDAAVFYGVALDLLDCVVAALGATAPAEALRGVISGPAVHDNCCAGQLTVSLIRHYESASFPQEFTGDALCGQTTTVLELAVTLLRCAPPITATGAAPTLASQSAVAQQVAADAYRIRAAAACCYGDGVAIGYGPGGRWVDTLGGCAGVNQTVLVDVGSVCCGS